MMRFIGEPVTQEEIDVSCYHCWNQLWNCARISYHPPDIILTVTQDILDEADTDKNGLIDYAEFANMMEPGRRFDGLQ